ncbi:MAG: hypothetical protein ICV59_07600 [Thermoleophilia bacterium]|nr:hypothetical protein [Thermoleophilia bacterium]
MNEPAVALDLEVAALLADEPELLAIADAVAATQAQPPRRRRWRRFVAVAAALAAAGALLALVPYGGGESSLLPEALAAIGHGPVLHARIEAELPDTNVVELATGRAAAQMVTIEYWFDEPRGRLRTVTRRGGVLVEDVLQTRAGATARRGRVVSARGVQPALDPGLAAFVTRYRRALATGEARRVGEGELEGRRVVWLAFAAGGSGRRVAVDAETYAPLVIVPLDADGRPAAFSWRVGLIESVARVEADFAPPSRRGPRPFRGDVRRSWAVSSDQVRAAVAWPALWLGESWSGLRLVSLERQLLTRGYPPGGGNGARRGQGVRLRYAADGRRSYVELSEAPSPEPAYAFTGGEATFDGNPIPPEGSIEISQLAGSSGGAPAFVGQLRRDGVYVTIWSSSRQLCLQAARALRRVALERGGAT